MASDQTPNDPKKSNPWGAQPPRSSQNKPQSPWGNPKPDNGFGAGAPDFENLFARFQGGGNGGDINTPKLALLGAGVLGILWLASGLYVLTPGEHAVVQRFGAWNRTETTEGLKYHLPSPIETVGKLNVNEIRTMNIGFSNGSARRGGGNAPATDVPDESLMLTSDFNIVDLDFVIQWSISSAENYSFNIEDPENTLRKAAQSAIREVVGQTRMFPIITTERGVVADKARAIMQKMLDGYKAGINISQVLITSAEVHPDVQNAFQDVQSAKQDAQDVQNRAQAYREDIVPKAKGQATKVVQDAEAYKESVVARASGDADRFNSVLSAYQSGQDVTKERMYIETMEEVLKNAQKVVLEQKGGSGVVPYLPLGEIGKTSTPAKQQ